ncbi:MAG: metallophosphoesterase [Fermentimonas sp.]
MKRWMILSMLATIAFGLSAQKLSFNEDGTFKIVQFTDMHYRHGDPRSDDNPTPDRPGSGCREARPGGLHGRYRDRAVCEEGWNRVTAPVIERGIPFIVTLGNHDHEYNVTRDEIAALITAYPYNLNSPFGASPDRVMDNVIPIYGGKRQLQEKALVYCFDSGDYSSMNGISGYNWITPDQIQWYREQSLFYTLKNNHEPLPAVAYFHIPLPEYRLAFDDDKNTRYGVRKEDECSPVLNTGHVLRDERDGRRDGYVRGA